MEFKEILEKVEGSSEFKEWKEKNQESYLAHGFIELGKDNEVLGPWQIGYYNPDSDRIVVIKLIDSKIPLRLLLIIPKKYY